MIDDDLYFSGIKYTILAALNQIIDRDGCGYFMAKNSIQPQHLNITTGIVNPMRIEYFLCKGSSHKMLPFR